jgi:hypothetical protein
MGGAVGPALASAVSNAGGLGMLPLWYADAETMRKQIREIRALTSKPFGVNLNLYGRIGASRAGSRIIPDLRNGKRSNIVANDSNTLEARDRQTDITRSTTLSMEARSGRKLKPSRFQPSALRRFKR